MQWCNADEITSINTLERAESDPLALVFCIYVDTRWGRALFLRGHLWWISCVCLILSGRLWSWVWHNISPAAATNSQTKGSHRRSYRPQRGMIYIWVHTYSCVIYIYCPDWLNEVEVLLFLLVPIKLRRSSCSTGCIWNLENGTMVVVIVREEKRNYRSRDGECNRSDVKKRGIVAAGHQGAPSSSDGKNSALYLFCFFPTKGRFRL